jgi:transposase
MTLPVCYSWYPRGKPLSVAYEASEGRRVNAIGAYFPDGPLAGHFCYESFASLPKHARQAKRRTAEQVAQHYGLTIEQVGPIDAERFIAFVWKTAGRPTISSSDWKRERPLMIVLDNYSVHKCQAVREMQPQWERADIYVVYLPSYSPELSAIEPVWNDIKHNEMTTRSYKSVLELKQAVDDALARKTIRTKTHKTTRKTSRPVDHQNKTTDLEQRAT